MATSRVKGILETVTNLAEPEAEKLGLSLWDVRYEKEGSEWFLKILVDRKDGVFVEDCEKLSRVVSGLLDEADPIEDSYYLEVSSAGLDREIVKEAHFTYACNKEVDVKLYKPHDGKKSLSGVLKERLEDGIVLLADGEEIKLTDSEIAGIRLKITDF